MIEQLYADFNEKMLPAIQEGLQITQEYFTDLFGRYVTYLITVDIITIVVNVLIGGIVIYIYKVIWKQTEENYDVEKYVPKFAAALFLGFALFINFINIWSSALDLVKAVYIPEVRVYEELQQYRNQ